MSRFLLDTNIISEPVRMRPNPAVISKLQQSDGEVAISSITLHELLFGCYRLPASRRRERVEHYLREIVQPKIPILPYCHVASEWFAVERARLVSIGKTPAYADGQIAAIAKVNSLTLVTNNISDYADFSELSPENWFV
ncbi:type II toxin-antitoxin system VapC family toxin [Anabaena sp. CA = ATCC 33047]|uniref:type II toxin-antitoxin system VapC family toxin n=1 Tax=Anabaena sp. (strain CA / ATCC 33047) TaxID=52271 RepID=UPI000AF5939A|nr:type II toxin-antitoxin system VapC family toxin [Anabaena sp. CA = ATCC 33047]